MTLVLSPHQSARAAALKPGETMMLIERVETPASWDKQGFTPAVAYPDGSGAGWVFWEHDHERMAAFTLVQYPGNEGIPCPHGAPGTVLGVKEAFAVTRYTENYECGGDGADYEWETDLYGDPQPYLGGDPRGGLCAWVHYEADGEDKNPSEFYPCTGINNDEVLVPAEIEWRTPEEIPDWAIRTHLRVTETRVCRAQEIEMGEWVLADVDPATVPFNAWVWITGVAKA